MNGHRGIFLIAMRVLLVEDEPNAAYMLAKGLREQTYAVDVATDGDAAVFQAGTTDYDAVILDVMLPILDGFAGITRIILVTPRLILQNERAHTGGCLRWRTASSSSRSAAGG